MTIATDDDTRQWRKVRLKKLTKVYGGHYTAIVDANGKAHAYLNCAIPTKPDGTPVAPLYEAICEVCGHAYAHLLNAGTVCCWICRSDAVAIHALSIQEECAEYLGWKACELVDRRDRMSVRDIEGMQVQRRR